MNIKATIGRAKHQRSSNRTAFPRIFAAGLRRAMTTQINDLESKKMAFSAIFLELFLLHPGSQGYGRGTDFDYGIAGAE